MDQSKTDSTILSFPQIKMEPTQTVEPDTDMEFSSENSNYIDSWIEKNLGGTVQELAVEMDKYKNQQRDRRVCICGHSLGSHTVFDGFTTCQPSKHACSCKSVRAVLRAKNLRAFTLATKAKDPDVAQHPLMRGLVAARQKNIDVEFLGEPDCDACHSHDQLTVCYVTQNGLVSKTPTSHSAWLCAACRVQRRG